MIEVSLSELRAFIEAQPRDKRVEMMEVGIYSPTGDLMVQYGKAQGWDFDYCGRSNWRKMVGTTTTIVACIKGGDVFDLFKNRQIVSKYKYTYQTLIDNLV